MRKAKKTLALVLALVMSCSIISGCGKKSSGEEKDNDKPTSEATATQAPSKSEKTTIIRIGTNSRKGVDPTYIDPVTGKPQMQGVWLDAALKARKILKDELNVELEYIEYTGSATEVLLKSVLANDPLCDVGTVPWGVGIVIGQNVFQPIDEYADMFKDPEYNWIFLDKIYGHNYLLSSKVVSDGPNLTFNIGYLDKVSSLKENGETVYPTDLWKAGKWTWSAFEDYLTKVKQYYINKKAPVRQDVTIQPYATMVINLAKGLICSTGESLFDSTGIGVASEDTKRAVKFTENLVTKGLVTDANNKHANYFKDGEVVFTDIAPWQRGSVNNSLVERGESMGIVPYPRPDDMAADDPKYKMVTECAGVGILRGIPKEHVKKSVETMRLYYAELFKAEHSLNSITEYLNSDEKASEFASLQSLDVMNPKCGKDIVDAFKMNYAKRNEYYVTCPWIAQWNTLAKNAILGLDGSPKYEIAIDEQKAVFEQQNKDIENILNSDKAHDNIAPAITLVGKDIALTKGTDGKTIDWSKYIKITDNVDGDLDIKSATIDATKIKFDTAGFYDKSLLISAKDKEGNEKKAQMGVVIYDPDNKEAPVLKMKETYRAVKLNEDASKINWGKDFVEAATSKEGFDLKAYVTADISSLDVTTAGKYEVTLTVTDYAGNKTEQKIKVTVAGK